MTRFAEYTRFGLDEAIRIDFHKGASDTDPVLRYNLAHGQNGAYDGLDRFDRIVDLRWTNYAGGTTHVNLKHGYDRAGKNEESGDTIPVLTRWVREFRGHITNYGAIGNPGKLRDLFGVRSLNPNPGTHYQLWRHREVGQTSGLIRTGVDGRERRELAQDRTHNHVNEIDVATTEFRGTHN